MILTPNQIDELMKVIDKYTLTFAAHHIGINGLDTNQLNILRASGVNPVQISSATSNLHQAFKFGILSDALGQSVVKNMSYPQLLNHIGTGKVFKLNALETAALDNLEYQTVKQVTKFSNKIKDQIVDKLVYADKKLNTVKHGKIVTSAAKTALTERKAVNSVISDIGHSLNEWNRDFGRIADFVMHTAFDEGRAVNIAKEIGTQALVYKDVYPGACPHCIKHYLTGGIASAPKIMTLAQLQGNGTNVGRKAKEWLPVIGPLHPWCRCTLMRVPKGLTQQDYINGVWVWNGQDFVRDLSKYKRKVQRKSKVAVTVNGVTTNV
jgi:hypothetical protein